MLIHLLLPPTILNLHLGNIKLTYNKLKFQKDELKHFSIFSAEG
jgi:hypothetical protein